MENTYRMKENTEKIITKFLDYLTTRDLDALVALFAEEVDWDIPGNQAKAPWLGKRHTQEEVRGFYELLWKYTEPVSANISHIFVDDTAAVVAGNFSTKMLPKGEVVDSPFYITIRVEQEKINYYRLLEDSYAVSEAMSQ